MRGTAAVTVAVLTLVGGRATALAGADDTWRASIETGANLSKWHPTGPGPFGESSSSLYATFPGFYVGGSLSIPLRFASVRAGVAFSRRGTEIPADPESVRMDYLEAPLLVEVRPAPRLRIRPVILGGVTVSRFLHARSSQFPESDEDGEFAHTDVGLVVGVAAEVSRVAVETKYTWGVTGLKRGASSGNLYNRCWSVGLRVALWRGRRTTR